MLCHGCAPKRTILKAWAREEGASDAIIPPANDNVARFLSQTNAQYQSIIAATLSANAARAGPVSIRGRAGRRRLRRSTSGASIRDVTNSMSTWFSMVEGMAGVARTTS